MISFANILKLENIQLDIPVTSKKRAFEQAALLFENNNNISRTTVFDSLFSRERLGSTALGHGVAVPHGRIPQLLQPLAAFLRLESPIPFDAPDNDGVSILVVLLVPENATQEHLEILASLARILSNEENREKLKQEKDPQQILSILTEEPT